MFEKDGQSGKDESVVEGKRVLEGKCEHVSTARACLQAGERGAGMMFGVLANALACV